MRCRACKWQDKHWVSFSGQANEGRLLFGNAALARPCMTSRPCFFSIWVCFPITIDRFFVSSEWTLTTGTMKGARFSMRFLAWVACCSYYLFSGTVAKSTTHSISLFEA